MKLFSESGVVARALDTASTFEGPLGGSLGDGSLPGDLVEYAAAIRRCIQAGERLRGLTSDGVFVVSDRRSCRGGRANHLAAGSILSVL